MTWHGWTLALLGLVVGVAGYRYWTGGDEHPGESIKETPSLNAAVSSPDLGVLGQPRADLTAEELAAFNEGKRLFTQKLPGLGPLYNAESCADCHFHPTLGGGGDFSPALSLGRRPGGEIQLYHDHALPGWTVPSRPPGVSRRIAPPLYGLGLVELIPDDTIRAACGQGHVNLAKQQGSQPANVVARFGGKPFLGTVLDIVGSEICGEHGVSNPLEGPGSHDDDSFPDPEVGVSFAETLAAYVRGLRPPGRNGTDASGEAAFHSLGCAACHVPDMPPALGVFSDFCLHRMGEGLADGILDKQAEGDEFGTRPLWGLRFRKLYLHDGRATSLDDAIKAHGGEAASSVRAYQDAPSDRRAALLRFLQTL